jgi:hypothetical protein
VGLGGAGVGLGRRAWARGVACTGEGRDMQGRGARRARARGVACTGEGRGVHGRGAQRAGVGVGRGPRRRGSVVLGGVAACRGGVAWGSAAARARGGAAVRAGGLTERAGRRRGAARRRRPCSDGGLKRAIETSERRPRTTI